MSYISRGVLANIIGASYFVLKIVLEVISTILPKINPL